MFPGIYVRLHLYGLAQAAITQYHSPGGLTNGNDFFMLLEAGSRRSQCQCRWVLVRVLFLACRQPPSHWVLMWLRVSSLKSFLTRTLILSDQDLMTSVSLNSRKALSPNTNWGLGFQHTNFGRTRFSP